MNIDKQAWIGEDMLATPSPDMFRIQQLQVRAAPVLHPTRRIGAAGPPHASPSIAAVAMGPCYGAVAGASCGWAGVLSTCILPLQIFNLMKFDSYTRFVKSPLYQACLRAESQGQPLPDLRPHSRSSSPPPDLSKVSGVGRGAQGPVPLPEKMVLGPFPAAQSKHSPRLRTEKWSGDRGKRRGSLGCAHAEMLLRSPQKSKLKLGKSLPLGVETAGSSANRSPRRSFRKGERREPSWAGRCCAE